LPAAKLSVTVVSFKAGWPSKVASVQLVPANVSVPPAVDFLGRRIAGAAAAAARCRDQRDDHQVAMNIV
jgi:hypothetical protein